MNKICTSYVGARGETKSVSTFKDDNEVIKFMNLVDNKVKEEIKQNISKNKIETLSVVRARIHDELMYIYLSRDLEGFANYDNHNFKR